MKSLSVLAVIVFSTLAVFTPAWADDNIGGLVRDFNASNLKLLKSLLEFDKMRAKARVESIDDTKVIYQRLQGLKKGMSGYKEKEVVAASNDLMLAMEGIAGLVGVFAPKSYNKEINPVVFGQAKGKALPKKPTALQGRLIKAGEMGFDNLMKEVYMVIAEDRKALERELAVIQAKIDVVDKELKKLEKK